jgi:hypothetical protein
MSAAAECNITPFGMLRSRNEFANDENQHRLIWAMPHRTDFKIGRSGPLSALQFPASVGHMKTAKLNLLMELVEAPPNICRTG